MKTKYVREELMLLWYVSNHYIYRAYKEKVKNPEKEYRRFRLYEQSLSSTFRKFTNKSIHDCIDRFEIFDGVDQKELVKLYMRLVKEGEYDFMNGQLIINNNPLEKKIRWR